MAPRHRCLKSRSGPLEERARRPAVAVVRCTVHYVRPTTREVSPQCEHDYLGRAAEVVRVEFGWPARQAGLFKRGQRGLSCMHSGHCTCSPTALLVKVRKLIQTSVNSGVAWRRGNARWLSSSVGPCDESKRELIPQFYSRSAVLTPTPKAWRIRLGPASALFTQAETADS